jgi:hypothetical protein
MKKRAYTKKQKAAAKPGARMKGGTRYAPELEGWIAMLHIWPNTTGEGEPTEYTDGKVFPTEMMALGHYHKTVRPALQEIQQKMSQLDGVEEIKNLLDEELN